jgi:hypothetical protein
LLYFPDSGPPGVQPASCCRCGILPHRGTAIISARALVAARCPRSQLGEPRTPLPMQVSRSDQPGCGVVHKSVARNAHRWGTHTLRLAERDDSLGYLANRYMKIHRQAGGIAGCLTATTESLRP